MEYRTVRNIFRLNKIAKTLIRYGFGGLVSELKLMPYFSFMERLFIVKRVKRGLSVPERVRLVLEELGPTFIKLGQVLSTRADILPPEWIEELKKLQDMVPPFPTEDARRVVERSLAGNLESKFASFEQEPIASASIAQVHYARLNDGTEVAVKVKRPNIEGTIEADISVMYTLARLLTRHVPASRRYRPTEVVDEFARVIHNELDFTIEGANASRFARIFEDDERVKIPRVYWNYTSHDVLTLERISGTPLDEVEKIKAKGIDTEKLAVAGLTSFFKQVFDYGIFHADLHPGNIFVRDDGVIIFLDFGIVGTLDRELRRYLANMLLYLVKQDYRKLALVHRQLGLIDKDVDLQEFEHALRDIAEPVFGQPLENINISTLLTKLIQTARRFRMKLQPNLLLLQKSMVIIEGVGRQLYPKANMWETIKPLIYKWIIKEKLSPKSHVDRGKEFAEELSSTLFDLPGQTHSLLSTTLKDELKIGFVHHRLENLSEDIHGVGKQIAGGIVAASLVLSACLYALFSRPGVWSIFEIPVLSIIGVVVAAAIGIKIYHSESRDRGGDGSGGYV